MIEKVALALHGTTKIQVGDKKYDFKAPFKRISIYDAIKENTGIDISGMDEADLREVCRATEYSGLTNHMGKGKLIDEIFGAKC